MSTTFFTFFTFLFIIVFTISRTLYLYIRIAHVYTDREPSCSNLCLTNSEQAGAITILRSNYLREILSIGSQVSMHSLFLQDITAAELPDNHYMHAFQALCKVLVIPSSCSFAKKKDAFH